MFHQLTRKEEKILSLLDKNGKRFTEIKRGFQGGNITITDQGLTKVLKKLIKIKMVRQFLDKEGVKRYTFTQNGQIYIERYYFPLLEELNDIEREKWLSRLFDFYSDSFQLIWTPNVSYQPTYYIVPLSLELHQFSLQFIATKIIYGELMKPLSDRYPDVFIVTKVKLRETEKLARAFEEIWNSEGATEEELFDILSNLIAEQQPPMKRIIISSIISMLLVPISLNDKMLVKRSRNILREMEELIFKNPDLTSDLDSKIIDFFVEDIDKGVNPLEDHRLPKDSLIKSLSTSKGETNVFSNLTLDYIQAAILRKPKLDFAEKIHRIFGGTQSLLLRTAKYELSENLDRN